MARSFDPFRDMERLFSEVARPSQTGLSMDLYRSGDQFVAEFDLPGVDPSSIDIDIDDRTLTVRAERKNQTVKEEGQWLVRERETQAAFHAENARVKQERAAKAASRAED